MKKKRKQTMYLFSSKGKFLKKCSSEKARYLLNSNRAIRLNRNNLMLLLNDTQIRKYKQSLIKNGYAICYICGEKIHDNITIDHIMPKSRHEFANIEHNLKCCCERCNHDKDNLTLSEYVNKIKHNRETYLYISDKKLSYLERLSKHNEDEFHKKIKYIPKSW